MAFRLLIYWHFALAHCVLASRARRQALEGCAPVCKRHRCLASSRHKTPLRRQKNMHTAQRSGRARPAALLVVTLAVLIVSFSASSEATRLPKVALDHTQHRSPFVDGITSSMRHLHSLGATEVGADSGEFEQGIAGSMRGLAALASDNGSVSPLMRASSADEVGSSDVWRRLRT